MSRPEVLVVANVTDADAGYVGERLEQRGFELRTVHRESGEVPAEAGGAAVVVLLGSEWSVHAPADAATLDLECRLVRSAQGTGVPVLGLCYGAQVVAHAFGGSVSPASSPEIGFVPVDSEDEHLVPTGPWPQFHVDVLAPPADARVLARNACGVQAFLLPGVLAVQFHPEVRPATLDDWARRFPDIVAAGGLDRATLVGQARAREPSARAAAYALVDAFLDRVPGGQVVAARSESRP